jgi:hypothetical protein
LDSCLRSPLVTMMASEAGCPLQRLARVARVSSRMPQRTDSSRFKIPEHPPTRCNQPINCACTCAYSPSHHSSMRRRRKEAKKRKRERRAYSPRGTPYDTVVTKLNSLNHDMPVVAARRDRPHCPQRLTAGECGARNEEQRQPDDGGESRDVRGDAVVRVWV